MYRKLIAIMLAATMTVTALPNLSFAADETTPAEEENDVDIFNTEIVYPSYDSFEYEEYNESGDTEDSDDTGDVTLQEVEEEPVIEDDMPVDETISDHYGKPGVYAPTRNLSIVTQDIKAKCPGFEEFSIGRI